MLVLLLLQIVDLSLELGVLLPLLRELLGGGVLLLRGRPRLVAPGEGAHARERQHAHGDPPHRAPAPDAPGLHHYLRLLI